MNRVRALMGGRRRRTSANSATHTNTTPTPTSTNETSTIVAHTNESDQFSFFDQQTITDDENVEVVDEEDIATIGDAQTFISESQTIGDLQTRGYVNRCPNFNSIRTIPLVSILLTRGFFAFSSEVSYTAFLSNKRKLDETSLLNNGGIGVPLFHAVVSNVIKSLLGSSKQKAEPVMKIFKYQIVDNGINLSDFPNFEILSQDNDVKLIKFEFCQISKQIDHFNSSKVIHTLTFYSGKEVKMVNFSEKRDIDTNVDDLPLRWFGFSGFASPFGSNDIKLLVLDDHMPTFMNENNGSISNTVNGTHISNRSLGAMPIWGRFSDATTSMLPTKRTVKLAEFKIKEVANQGNSSSPLADINTDTSLQDGITQVPESTQILTCMCMMLNEYESRKERRHKNLSPSVSALPSE